MIYILARYPKLDNGHYWSFDSYIRSALYENNLSFVFINPESNKAETEDRESFGNKSTWTRYVNVLDDKNFVRDCIHVINRDLQTTAQDQIIILIPWLPQFDVTDLESISQLESDVEVIYVGLTILDKGLITGMDIGPYRYQFEEFFLSRKKRLLWVSDIPPKEYATVEWIRKMPDFAETAIDKSTTFTYDLSFFGLLSSYRGLFEILMIAFFNPGLKVRIKGYGFRAHRIFRPWKLRVFRYGSWRDNPFASVLFSMISLIVSGIRFLPNVHFSKKPFETESDIDKAISKTRVMFYCPKLPHGSGLTNKSLAGGIPILWHGWNGVAFDLLSKSYPQGYFRYREVFIPGRIHRKIKSLQSPQPMQDEMRRNFLAEILELKKFG
jgi:hypothetical protein